MLVRSKEFVLLILFIVLFAVMGALSPNNFLSIDNLQSMAFQIPEFGILALAMMMVIISGGIDLSITSVAALSGIASAFTLRSLYNEAGFGQFGSILLALLVCIAVAALCGLFNGLIIAYIGVSPILATLGAMTLLEGVSLKFTKGGAISGFPDGYSWFGNATLLTIPVPILIFLVIAVLMYFLLEKTPWGQSIYMIGNNMTATMYSGISTRPALLKTYILASVLAGIAAIIMTSRYNSAKVDYGSSYLLLSVAAAVLGGTSITGGSGKVVGTVIAVGIFQVISTGFNIIGMNRNLVDIMIGGILILVLIIHYFRDSFRRIAKGVVKKTGTVIQE